MNVPTRRRWLLFGAAGFFAVLFSTGAARGDFLVTLPAAASLHGVPPAFFHSDVWVFNGSAENATTVTATYRCAGGNCGNAVQTFTIPPRQVRAFPDIVATLFGAPETFGAVEFESRTLIVVTSRLYSPARGEPTIGMYVGGLKEDDAHSSSVLTSLSHSANPGSGFRTNVGVYNPNDVAQPLSFSFFAATGAFLGQFFDTVGARRPLQINDAEIFRRLNLSGDVRDFFTVVTGDGVHPLYAYASVIDNRSADPIYIPGEDAAGLAVSKVTLPAAASLHGAGQTFFHSDARVWNASATAFATVTARYVCFTGGCGDSQREVLIAPRQMIVLDDIVASFFQAPESGGAVEFVSEQPLVVTSRLYTPARSEPTFGMFVPGMVPDRASPAQVLNGLARSGDSRVNVGVFNDADPQVITYRLFDGNGNLLGISSRSFGKREVFQVNDIFSFLGVSAGSVESAYCLVEGSELLPIFSYAAVIDNRSQDPIFIPGEDDPEKPPIRPSGIDR
ncbi:MAG: hypothetical protein M3542_09790 [Acidobacteriota bacterium]|nr:hypothetical protein [Acidobacteriota bacterium]MDQ5871454.1 hypothetical protein [Acidobacteriota bacterium]